MRSRASATERPGGRPPRASSASAISVAARRRCASNVRQQFGQLGLGIRRGHQHAVDRPGTGGELPHHHGVSPDELLGGLRLVHPTGRRTIGDRDRLVVAGERDLDRPPEQLRLGREAGIDGRHGDVGRLGDRSDGGRGEAPLDEQRVCGGEDPPPALAGAWAWRCDAS